MAEEAKPQEGVQEEVTTQEVKVKITPELVAVIEKASRDAVADLKEKQKAFAFHGSAENESALSKAKDVHNAVVFFKAVAQGDHATAVEYSDQRAKELGFGDRELVELQVSTKAINIAGSAGSQYLVPRVFENEIYGTFDTYDEIISDANVQNFNKAGNVFNLNELDTRVVSWFVDEDAAGLTSSQPTFSEPLIAIADQMASTTLTLDFLEDTEADIMSNLAKQFGEAFAQKLQARLINGDVTVSGIPVKGLLNTPGLNEVLLTNTTGGYTTVTPTDIENMWFSAIALDHFQTSNRSGKFYMNPSTMAFMRKNIRSAGSAGKDDISLFNAAEMTILGQPVVFTNQMPVPTTTLSNPFVLYGNLKNHLQIRRKRGLTMKINDSGTARDGRNLNWQLGREIVMSQRIGHTVVLPEGLTVLST